MTLAALLLASYDSDHDVGAASYHSPKLVGDTTVGAMSDATLVARLQAGDTQALALLMETYYPQLLPFVRRYVGSTDVADDVLQDLFLRLWDRRAEWQLRGSLRAYVYTAARNMALHARARRNARIRAEQSASAIAAEEAEPFDVARAIEQRDLAALVRAAVAELPERCREIFVLSREHGLSYSEIAETLGVSVSTVKTQMGRAMVALDRRLAPLLGTM